MVWIWLNSPLFLCHPINKTSSWSTIYSHPRHTDHSFLAILSRQVWAVQMGALRLGFSSEQNQHAWEETPPLSSRPAPRHQLQPHQNNNVIFSRQGKELELWRIISCWPCCRSSDVFYLPLIFLSSFFFFFILSLRLSVSTSSQNEFHLDLETKLSEFVLHFFQTREKEQKKKTNLTRLLRKRSRVWNGATRGTPKTKSSSDITIPPPTCTISQLCFRSGWHGISFSGSQMLIYMWEDHLMRVYSQVTVISEEFGWCSCQTDSGQGPVTSWSWGLYGWRVCVESYSLLQKPQRSNVSVRWIKCGSVVSVTRLCCWKRERADSSHAVKALS